MIAQNIWRNVFAGSTIGGAVGGFFMGVAGTLNKNLDTPTCFENIYRATAGGVILGLCWPVSIAAAVATLVTK